MLQVYVSGKFMEGYLELPPDTTLQMDITAPAFDDDLAIGEYSLPLEVDFTPYNSRLLGFAEMLNEQYTDDVNYWRVNVISDGVPELQDAKMTLLKSSGTFDYRRGRFTFSIAGNKGLFGSLIKNKKLTDLQYGGKITWQNMDSRQFATAVMKGTVTKYPFIRFGPVVRENYFDTDRIDYDNEFIVYDTVNNVHVAGGNWQFGRPTSANTAIAAVPGTAEYKDYRTIPFLQLYYVTKRIFEENGYSVTGDFFTSGYFEDLVLDNNRSLEKYHISPNQDVNREIVPANHVPDVLIHDYLVALQKRFNLKISFRQGRKVEISFKQNNNRQRKTLSLTPILVNQYERSFLEFQDQGFTLQSDFDTTDDYHSDAIQDIKDKTLVATVKTRGELASLNINRQLTLDDIAFVTAENLYYRVANATITPVLWEAYSERLDDYVIGKGDNTIPSALAPLCTYMLLNQNTGLVENRDVTAVRQKGSYINKRGLPVINAFGMRIFYCKNVGVGSLSVPKTFVHNRDNLNARRVPYSLSWYSDDGIFKSLYEEWINFLLSTRELQTTITLDQKWWKEVQEADIFTILGIDYTIKNIQINFPLSSRSLTSILLYRYNSK